MYVMHMLFDCPCSRTDKPESVLLNELLVSFYLELAIVQKAVDKFSSVNILKIDFLYVFQ